MQTQDQTAEVKSQLDSLQLWFARKGYGFTERCSPEQLQQYRDRETEMDRLINRLEILQG